jgi:hypothetical protein
MVRGTPALVSVYNEDPDPGKGCNDPLNTTVLSAVCACDESNIRAGTLGEIPPNALTEMAPMALLHDRKQRPNGSSGAGEL